MKNLFYLTLLILMISSCEKEPGNDKPVVLNDSISMGAGYANDIFYSLENGVVKTSPRDNWDLAFATNLMTSTILINEGYGIELYAYPNGDKDDWDAIDTTGIENWKKLYNADTTWSNGAFERNAKGHPDYGWGVYNMQNHYVIGDSVFIIKLSDGTLNKLFIEQRSGSDNTFIIKYGAINEAGVTKEIPCNDYTSKNFVYYSISREEVVDHEPALADWDLVFTKYHDESIPYIVTGVLTNGKVSVAEVRDTEKSLADYTTAEFSSYISIIGSDWKSFDMGTFSYKVEPDLSYFIKKNETEIYQMVFTGTDGSMSGKVVFELERIN